MLVTSVVSHASPARHASRRQGKHEKDIRLEGLRWGYFDVTLGVLAGGYCGYLRRRTRRGFCIGAFGGYLSYYIVSGSFWRPLEVSYGHWLAE